MAPLLEHAFGPNGLGEWKLVPIRANRQPAAASYLRRPGDDAYRAYKLDVLRVVCGQVAENTIFDATLFGAFGPPELWSDTLRRTTSDLFESRR